jgi:chemotaxis protein methyltransferase CheR
MDFKEFELNDKEYFFLTRLVNEKTGIVLGENRKDMLYSRIVRRIRTLKLNNFQEYCNFISSKEGEQEIGEFINAVTTNLTKFFREEYHFEELKKILHEQIIPNNNNGIRIWSAGCSTGQEPYSIAMTIINEIPDYQAMDIKILATDIDTNVLDKANTGIYSARDVESIPDNYKRKFITQLDNNSYQVSSQLKDIIRFKRLNLLADWPMKGEFHIIFCRNVVIYFDKDTQKKLFDRYADIMIPQGFLFIGHSENLYNVSDRFQLIGKTIYRKIK